MHRLAVATADAFPDLYDDDRALVDPLADRGVTPMPCVWDDPAVDWSAYDAVLVRTIWDYTDKYPAYLAWLDRLDALGVPAINDTSILRRNSDKGYLAELGAAGAPVVPTVLSPYGALAGAIASVGGEVVVKPTVSGGARNTVRGPAGSLPLDELAADRTYMVQPYLAEIETAGEWSLFFYGGRFSHAVRKVPAAGDYRVQLQYGGAWRREDPSAEVVEAGGSVLDAAVGIGFRDISYARVDGVETADGFRLMELEVIEPFLGFYLAPESAGRFADVIVTRLGSVPRRR
jgi:glutathione synthase/RimK-type ligase-like ATP-grasp enzyme